ncbi:penicillin acylase family protein [Myxococcota bacterium]|nr:penicillin acylase family protein [Myxococcota bacterium]
MKLDGVIRRLFDASRILVGPSSLLAHKRERLQNITLKGLRGQGEVITDSWGVPHVHADNTYDLFFLQGYATARDRLFQMDFNRHAATGRLSELVGRRPVPWKKIFAHFKDKDILDFDIFVRAFDLEGVSQKSLLMHSDESLEILQAYADGVNRYIEENGPTLEHRIVGFKPKPWRPVDSLVLLRVIGFELNYSWRAILGSEILANAGFPADILQTMWGFGEAPDVSIVSDADRLKQLGELAALAHGAHSALGTGDAPGLGSNCFAVGANLSATGHPILANDTHLRMTTPSPWHEVALFGAGHELRGFTLGGAPGIAIGRSKDHAWGITAGLVHDLDLYAEKIDPNNPKNYLTPDGSEPFEVRKEVFNVKGQGTVERDILVTRHGPVLDSLATTPKGDECISFKWTGQRPGADLEVLTGAWKARSFDEFREAMGKHICPTYSVSYVGDDGELGYALVGDIPIRKKDTPLRILPGWTNDWEWEGLVPQNENPYLKNPSKDYVVTANARPVGADYPYELGHVFEPAARHRRLIHLLETHEGKISAEDFQKMQLDDYSAWGLQVRDYLLPLIETSVRAPVGSLEAAALEVWRSWDGYTSIDSQGATLGITLPYYFGRKLITELSSDEAVLTWLEMASLTIEPLVRLLEHPDELAKAGVDLGAIALDAFSEGLSELIGLLGSDVGTWKWGQLHQLSPPHALDGSPLQGLYNMGPVPAAGGPDTVNRGDISMTDSFNMRVGAAMRMVVECGPDARMQTVLPGGESENRFSDHYDDQLALFLSGGLKKAAASLRDVDIHYVEKCSGEISPDTEES